MQTIEERAEIITAAAGPWSHAQVMAEFRALVRLNLLEVARDQRHLCAEAVYAALDDLEHNRLVCTDAHAAVMNTAEPGQR